MTRPAGHDGATRERALALADEHGAAEASRLTGVPAATIRSWRLRAGKSGPPAGADPSEWADAKREAAGEAFAVAREALAKVRALLKAGKGREAQAAAVTMAVLVDKSGVLEIAAAQADERQARLSEAQARELVERTRRALEDLGVPYAIGSPVAQVLAAHWRAAANGVEPEIATELLDAARQQTRVSVLVDAAGTR